MLSWTESPAVGVSADTPSQGAGLCRGRGPRAGHPPAARTGLPRTGPALGRELLSCDVTAKQHLGLCRNVGRNPGLPRGGGELHPAAGAL